MQPFRRMRPAFWAFLFGLFIGWQMGAETPPEPPPPPKPAIRTAAVPGPTPSPAATAPSATVRATPDLLPSPADRAAPAESARGGAHAAPGGPVPAAVPRTPSAWDSPSALRTVDAAGPAAPTASPEPRAALSAAVAVSGQLPDPPFAVLIPKSPPPLPPGWPAQPPRPVGVMSLQECLDYIKSRQWSVQSDPRSQSIACQPQPPPQPLLLGAECHALSARAPFSVELCWDPATGEGRMRIEKRSGCAEAEAFTEDADTARDVRARLGPDSLRVRLEGPEVLVLDMAHEGACVYTGRFHVTTSGWFTLQCTHLFDQYHAVTELKPKTRYVARSLTEGRYRVGLPLQKEAPPAPALPCRDLWGAPARWWRPPDVRPYVDPFPPWKFPRTPGKNLAQADSWGSDARWTPYNCTWAPLAQSAARACFAGARVLFIGDSMTRSFFYPTLNRLWEDRIVGNPKITVADGPKKWTVTPDILMQYAPDPFLDEDKMFKTMVQGSDFDLVVLGMGDWPASSTIQPKGLWPLKRYKAHVDKVIAALAAFVGRTRARVVWHTIPAFGIADFDAWRNNRRFELYNEYAVERARGAGLEVIDLYAMSLPMTHAAHDGGHFTTFVADLWADVLIYQLCSRGQTLKR